MRISEVPACMWDLPRRAAKLLADPDKVIDMISSPEDGEHGVMQSLRYLSLCMGPVSPRPSSYSYRLKHRAEELTIDGHSGYVFAGTFARVAEICGAPLRWTDTRYGHADVGVVPPRICNDSDNCGRASDSCGRLIQRVRGYRCGEYSHRSRPSGTFSTDSMRVKSQCLFPPASHIIETEQVT